ncbi:hypothetical protein MAR_007572 [Mya arenaria]|uniref:Endonuclease/exonuclease/phosphatase domain-containing protein n=1 Tax=Mya arenaria TaxID=6604 RepID=A0ABY7DBN6_MYAAR|nr:hypothetical protein MAR_007572 [Mya arenaria]
MLLTIAGAVHPNPGPLSSTSSVPTSSIADLIDTGLSDVVAIYARVCIQWYRRFDLEMIGLESLLIDLTVQHRKLLIEGFYNPQTIITITKRIDNTFTRNSNILIVGDFNVNVLDSPTKIVSRLLSSYNAHQLITKPTNFNKHSSTLIDLMIMNHHE